MFRLRTGDEDFMDGVIQVRFGCCLRMIALQSLKIKYECMVEEKVGLITLCFFKYTGTLSIRVQYLLQDGTTRRGSLKLSNV